MTKAQMITYGILLITKLLGRLRQLNEVESEEDVAAIQGEMANDIASFSAALSSNREQLDAWLMARQ